MMKVGPCHCDISTLRRDLDEIGEGIEEVTELTVLNDKRLWRSYISNG